MPATPWRRAAFGVAAAIVLAVVFLIASPGARRAVADLLGLPGVRIELREQPPAPAPATREDNQHAVFGRRVDMQRAAAAVDFSIPVPASIRGAPEVYFLDEAEAVTLAYPPSGNLPEIEGTGYGLIVVALRGYDPERYFGKLLAGRDPVLDAVEVNGRAAYWTEAAEHTFAFGDRLRSSGNALLWERDGVTIRVEAALGLAGTLRVAESIPDG